MATAANTLSSLFLFHPPVHPPFSNLYRHGLQSIGWGMFSVTDQGTMSLKKRLSFKRSWNFNTSAASSDGDYSRIQLQGCCSQTSLNSNGSLPGAAGHPGAAEHRVAGWSTCFERLLQDSVGVRYFSEFLKKEFSEENILFWQACEYFSHVPATDKKQ
ncbi:Regulator of G-protein signaling 12, partial [Ilyodon furcidens]